jgi:hypothetical protein
MDLLAGRVHNLKCGASRMTVAGEILVNNEPMRAAAFRRASAYVQQQDDLPSTETVRECLMFSAQLRLPDSLTQAERKKRVESIIAEMVGDLDLKLLSLFMNEVTCQLQACLIRRCQNFTDSIYRSPCRIHPMTCPPKLFVPGLH